MWRCTGHRAGTPRPTESDPPNQPSRSLDEIESENRRIKPVPDPTPEEPKEVVETDPEPEFNLPDDVDVVFGEP